MRSIILAMAVAAACAGGAAAQPEPAVPDTGRAPVLAAIRAGDDDALRLCRDYLARRPWDGLMRYNLACLEARAGRPDSALASLALAVRPGGRAFDDPLQLEADPDLAPLRDDPRFAAIATELRARLVLAAAERGLRLAPGVATPLRLLPNGPSPWSTLPEVDVTWRADALVLRLPAGAWRTAEVGAPRLFVTLGSRDPDEPWLTRDGFLFSFGTGTKGGAWGAVWVPTLERWLPVAELAPRLDAPAGGATVAIPWSLVQPLHPLTDPQLGLNVTVPADGPDGAGADRLAAVADPRAWDPAAPARRIVHLDCDASSWREPAFLGRLDRAIVGGGELEFELVAVAPTAGRGTLRIDFLDNQARSVLPDGPVAGTLDLAAGLQRLPRRASFAGLRTGSYQLRAELGFPGGGSAVWSSTVLNLAPGWADSLRDRLAGVAPPERRTAAHLLAAVERGVAEHPPRRHPGPVATTLGDLDAMLARAAATGSVLPAEGTGLLVYPGPDGTDRLCSVFRPGPGARRGAETPVLVIDDAPGGEDRLVGRLARFYAEGDLSGAGGRRPLYLVPHLPARDRAAEARAALDFARDLFGRRALPAAGVDAGGGPALVLAADPRGGVSSLMILAGARLAPWPGADDAGLAARLAALPPGLPVDWTDFTRETAAAGQGAALLRALAEAGGVRLTSRDAGGGPGPSQAADRIVLWAEELPVPARE